MDRRALRYTAWLTKHTGRLDGKTAVVTGGNSGIGYCSAVAFAYLGARVVLACRNPDRAAAAAELLRAQVPGTAVETATVDLSSHASVDAFAAALRARGEKIDVFLHCAGVYYPRQRYTEDGLPMTEGVNYEGTVRLAERVLPLMDGQGRMVFTTSLVDRFGRVDEAPAGEGYAAYARSKTLLSAYVMYRAASRREGEPSFLAAHPGITATNLLSPEKTTHKPLFSRLGHAFLYLFTHSPAKAALTGVRAAAGDGENGDVIGPRGLFGISGYPHKTRFCRNVRRTAEKRTCAPAPVSDTARSPENTAPRGEGETQ